MKKLIQNILISFAGLLCVSMAFAGQISTSTVYNANIGQSSVSCSPNIGLKPTKSSINYSDHSITIGVDGNNNPIVIPVQNNYGHKFLDINMGDGYGVTANMTAIIQGKNNNEIILKTPDWHFFHNQNGKSKTITNCKVYGVYDKSTS